MSTQRQEKLAEAIIENMALDKPRTAGEILEKVGYAQSTATTRPGDIMEAQGTQEALAKRGFTPEKAKETVAEIMTNPDEKARDRLTAADMTLKVHGSYAPEKKLNLNLNAEVEDFKEFAALSEEFDEKMKRKMLE